MIISTIHGNLLDSFSKGEFDAIIHGCNCYHTMGAGIAGQIAELFPEALAADCKTPIGPAKLGSFSYAMIERDGKRLGSIINMYTQDRPGREHPAVLEAALRQGFTSLNERRSLFSGTRPVIGIPLIGAGIAGGDWDRHYDIIDAMSANISVVVVKYSAR